MDLSIGTVAELRRYPVKSFAGESLQNAWVESYGIYGDRSHAFIDPSKQGWACYFTARNAPEMLRFQAKTGTSSSSGTPDITVTSPDGRILEWGEELLAEIQAFTSRKLSLFRHIPESGDQPAVDAESLLIVTEASVRKMGALWGRKLDSRRFRPNLLLKMDNDVPFQEREWIGKRISIGGVRLEIVSECERCKVITMDPDTLEQDATLLKKVKERADLRFGVYASVVQKGQIRLGDRIFLEQDN